MAISFIGLGSSVSAAGINGGVNFTIALPAGTTTGDLIILTANCRNTNNIACSNAAFATMKDNTTGQPIKYRIFTAGDATTLNCTLVTTGSTYGYVAVALVYRGVDTTTPIMAGPGTSTSTANPGLTTTATNAWVVGVTGGLVGTSNNYTPTAPFTTERVDTGNGGTSTKAVNLWVCDYIKAATGATGSVTFPVAPNTIFALREAVASTYWENWDFS